MTGTWYWENLINLTRLIPNLTNLISPNSTYNDIRKEPQYTKTSYKNNNNYSHRIYYPFITKWGIRGSDDGQFKYPKGIAVDTSGYVYVEDEEITEYRNLTAVDFYHKMGHLRFRRWAI